MNEETTHELRPVEYQTNLTSLLRHLQNNYLNYIVKKFPNDKAQQIIKLMDKNFRDTYFKALYKNNMLFSLKISDPEIKKQYIHKLYKIFVNNEIPYEFDEYTNQIVAIDEYIKNNPIQAKKTVKNESILTKPIKINYLDISNLEDENFDFVQTALGDKAKEIFDESEPGTYSIKLSKRNLKSLYRNLFKQQNEYKESNNMPYYENINYLISKLTTHIITHVKQWKSNDFTFDKFKEFIEWDQLRSQI